MGEAEAIRLNHSKRMSREWRFSGLINEANTALLCGGDLQEARRKTMEALALARQIPEDSLEEITPPRIMKTVALIQAGLAEGCDGAQPFFDEALTMTHGDPTMAGQEASVLFSEGTCWMARGDSMRAFPAVDQAITLGLQLWGGTNDITQQYRAFRAYMFAAAGQSQRAIPEARASVATLECHLPYACQTALGYAIQALMTAGDNQHALPLARQIADTTSRAAIIGKTALFVAYTEANQKLAAQPYRSAAETFARRLSPGILRSKIEKTLTH